MRGMFIAQRQKRMAMTLLLSATSDVAYHNVAKALVIDTEAEDIVGGKGERNLRIRIAKVSCEGSQERS